MELTIETEMQRACCIRRMTETMGADDPTYRLSHTRGCLLHGMLLSMSMLPPVSTCKNTS